MEATDLTAVLVDDRKNIPYMFPFEKHHIVAVATHARGALSLPYNS